MNSRLLILFIILLLPLQFLAQTRIIGTVKDKKSKQSIDFASIYINGSTQGALSDSLGNFHLDNVHFPCNLVISHLSYVTHTVYLKDAPTSPLNIVLKTKMNTIEEVSVQDKNLRKQNLETFKSQFLGRDTWGKYAEITNEDAIHFERDYIKDQSIVYDKKLPYFIKYEAINLQWSDDSTMISYEKPINLKATSLEPLKINLPLLGYTLYFDLVEFKLEYQQNFDSDLCTVLGYSYFKPIPLDSKRDSIRIEKNRRKVYYNSAQHFCRSLYENKLAENGYRIYEHIENNLPTTNTKKIIPKEARLDSHILMRGNYMEVTGLTNRQFEIHYYIDNKQMPKDLTKLKATVGVKSEILFHKDTCVIRNNGTVPDNSVVFGKAIGGKKIGSMLPDDYQPTQ